MQHISNSTPVWYSFQDRWVVLDMHSPAGWLDYRWWSSMDINSATPRWFIGVPMVAKNDIFGSLAIHCFCCYLPCPVSPFRPFYDKTLEFWTNQQSDMYFLYGLMASTKVNVSVWVPVDLLALFPTNGMLIVMRHQLFMQMGWSFF